MNNEILKELNFYYKREFLRFEKRGLVLKHEGALKRFLKEHNIFNEMEFSNRFYEFRDDVLISYGLDDVSFCVDNDLLYPYCLGLSNSPLFGFGGSLWGEEEDPVRYAFAYTSYVFFDFIEELVRNGEVCFDFFVDNSLAYNKALELVV